jgi:hypothetical protein
MWMEWVKMGGRRLAWNYKRSGRNVRGRPRRKQKNYFEAGTGIRLPKPCRQGGKSVITLKARDIAVFLFQNLF